jgi:hypothetical protein
MAFTTMTNEQVENVAAGPKHRVRHDFALQKENCK